MTTYEDGAGIRARYAEEALWSLLAHLKYENVLELHIADDSQDPEMDYIHKLQGIALRGWGHKGTYSCSNHRGIGASLNLALAKVDDLWLYTTDDWKLNKDINLDKAVQLIRECKYDYIRLGPLHPNLHCKTKFQQGIGWWLDVEPERGFAFATRPFVTTLDFSHKMGRFDEGLNSYETERLYAERFHVIAPAIRMAGYLSDGEEWEHLGEYTVGERDI